MCIKIASLTLFHRCRTNGCKPPWTCHISSWRETPVNTIQKKIFDVFQVDMNTTLLKSVHTSVCDDMPRPKQNVRNVRYFQVHFYPSALRAGGVLSSRSGRAGGRAGGCQTCGTHISVTAWWIFSIRSSMELSRPVVVHCHAHLPICPIRACPWAENLSNLPQIGSRLCGSQISETAGWIYPI